ncbi:zinc ABC transporter substrate-binding protein AztC [Stackebrandtia endophytica]|nr:zinc ABC transporter substrate-binding protein AztC [Stackebrandtia endophytica]
MRGNGLRSRRIAAIAVATVLVSMVTACGSDDDGGGGIVVTTNVLGDVVTDLVQGEADVTVLMQPDANPHSFGVSAREAAALERADLVIYNGLGLEEGVLHHVEAAAQAGVPTFEVAAHVDPIAYGDGESAGNLDPHFWTDPVRMSVAVELIGERIAAELSGVDADRIARGTAELKAEIDDLHERVEAQFAVIPLDRRKLITNHHVFGYLAQRYDFTVIGAVIPSGTTLASPSAADLKSLADAVTQAGVPAVFADSSQPDRLVRAMAEEAGVHIEVISLHSESLSEPGGGAETYAAMVQSNADAITRGLTE